MAVILPKVDAAALANTDFTFEFNQWLSVLVDTLNELIRQVQGSIMSTATVVSTTQAMTIDSNYIPLNVALTSFTLPLLAVVGARQSITGFGSGGWSLLTNAGQTIQVGATLAATSISSASRYDCIEIVCVVENTVWVTANSQTAGFVIV